MSNKLVYIVLIIAVLVGFLVFLFKLDSDCERQADGNCGWTQTEELKKCLESKQLCVYQDGSCCRGDICNIVNATCEDGLLPEIKGCDNNCQIIYECLAK